MITFCPKCGYNLDRLHGNQVHYCYAPSTNAVKCIQCGDWLAYYAKSFWTGNYGPRCERCHRVAIESPTAQRSYTAEGGY